MREGVVVDERDPRIEEIIKKSYSRIIYPNDDGSYSAEILEFFGCFSEGDTAEEAVTNVENAARSWVGTCLEEGIEIPEPFNNQEFNGKIALRLPRSLHRQAVLFAEREGISLNQFLVSSISERVGREALGRKLIKELTDTFLDQSSNSIFIKGFYIDTHAGSLANSRPSILDYFSFQNSMSNKETIPCLSSK